MGLVGRLVISEETSVVVIDDGLVLSEGVSVVTFVWPQWDRETVPRKNIEVYHHITNRSAHSRCLVSVGVYKYTHQHDRKHNKSHDRE